MTTMKDLNYLWKGLGLWALALVLGIFLRMDSRQLFMFVVVGVLLLTPLVLIFFATWKKHYFVAAPLLVLLGVSGYLFLTPISSIHNAANHMVAASHLRAAAIAMHDYHGKHQRFPPAANTSAEGKPLLSWRVLILPYLGEQWLYEEFHLNEPWDSEHNRKLLSRIPEVYRSVGRVTCPAGHTFIQAVVGQGTIFDPQEKVSLSQVHQARGLSSTILLMEGGQAVPWTKPEDITFHPGRGLSTIGGQFDETTPTPLVQFAFADGSVYQKTPPFPMNALAEAVQWRSMVKVELLGE